MSDYLLSGLRVVDCATVIAAPAAAMILADYGADVIKVEQPGSGDMLRMLSDVPITPDAGNDWFWQLGGRNKRSIALDLKSEDGMQILRQLISSADVFITNHPYPARENLGIRYQDIQSLNPKIIYASLTAYGEQGGERDRKGFDQLAYWARSGLMELMREPNTQPTQGIPGMGDHPTSISLYAGIMTALLHRERTGEGSMVSTSLLANGLWSAAGVAQGALAGGDMPAYRATNTVYSAMYRPYRTQDDRWLQLNMVRDEEMLSLTMAALDAIHLLADERFDSMEKMWLNRGALGDEIQQCIQAKDAAYWLAQFEQFDVPVNCIAEIEDCLTDPQMTANNMVIDTAGSGMETPALINHPINVSGVSQVGPRKAPALGEHGAEILRELGYSEDQITDLVAKHTI